MTDGKHPGDTLFIVAEADFRFYQADDMAPEAWAQVLVQAEAENAAAVSKSPPTQSRTPRDGPYGRVYKKSKQPRRESRGFVEPGREGISGGRSTDGAQEVQDLVTLCNAASRCRLLLSIQTRVFLNMGIHCTPFCTKVHPIQ